MGGTTGTCGNAKYDDRGEQKEAGHALLPLLSLGLSCFGLGFSICFALIRTGYIPIPPERELVLRKEINVELQRAQNKYTAHKEASSAKTVTTQRYTRLQVGDDDSSFLFYDGLVAPHWRGIEGILFRVGHSNGRQISYALARIPTFEPQAYYGDVDLMHELGLPLKLHVIRADAVVIEYSVLPSVASEKEG